MSIRKRLASFFVMMITLVIVMTVFLKLGGPVILGVFRQSLEAMHSLNDIRELKSNISNERASLSRYLLLDDPQEFFRFDEASKMSNKNLATLKGRIGTNNLRWYKDLENLFVATDQSAQRVANDYKKGSKVKAHDEWSTELSPKMVKLFEHVVHLENEKTDEADRMVEKIKNLNDEVALIALVVFAFVFVVGFAMFVSLYRAVMKPLEILKRGADEFGKGRWEHKIDLPSTNEFGSLAKSFNTMAENVKQLQLQAVHMDRMSAVGQLAGGVAHEINNPLTAVLGQTQILLAKMTEADPSYAQLKKIENAGIRCKKIVRGLLDFSRPSQSTFELLDINEILLSTMDLCEADLKKGKVMIEKIIGRNLPKMQGNPSELQQVLLNLINNAIQAMPRGGTLILETRLSKRPLTVLDRRKGIAPRQLDGPWLEVVVKDSGVGIAQEHIKRIFEPFFTTKEIGQGTGLGLAVSMGIVQKHGGSLYVESDGLNRGATFVLTLPLTKEAGTYLPVKRLPGMAA